VLLAFIPGTPAPQGSKRHVGNGVMIESSKAVKPWRESIRSALTTDAGLPRYKFEGAVFASLEFIMPRPKSLSKKATPHADKRPDLDKLARAALDSMTSAGVLRDDSCVVELSARKRIAAIGETAGLKVTVHDLCSAS
jgi:crossover junction endodeoxyribonuclease RusA